jgi:hypothetical protein
MMILTLLALALLLTIALAPYFARPRRKKYEGLARGGFFPFGMTGPRHRAEPSQIANLNFDCWKRGDMLQRFITAVAWASIAVIAYGTLSHVGVVHIIYETVSPMVARPAIQAYVHFEHIFAFAVVGALFCLAYPRSTVLVCSVVFGSAILLECFQTLTPDRHGTIFDALEKIAGGAIGILLGKIALLLSRQLAATKHP